MNNSERIEEIKSILADIESHIVTEPNGNLYFDGDGWECSAVNTLNDDNVAVWKVDDPYYTEYLDTAEEAKAWMVSSIDTALSVQIEEAIDEQKAELEIVAEHTAEIEQLNAVMTPAEIEKEFELAPGTVRQSIFQGRFTKYRRADGRTILVLRSAAVERWGTES